MDLKNPRLMYLKAVLFLLGGALSCALILMEQPNLKTAGLLALSIWCFARAYYFIFYVIEKYIDPGYRFSGIGSFLGYLLKRPKTRPKEDETHKT